jgi:hypothetical protein
MNREAADVTGGAHPSATAHTEDSVSTTSNTARTDWTIQLSNHGNGDPRAQLDLSINGAPGTSFKLKGVCYSPCPINANVQTTPGLGDFFWDKFSGPGYNIDNYEKTWREDLNLLREMNVNTIRLYSMMTRQMKDGKYAPVPFVDANFHLFTHTAFLDACWNGGNKPLYVLVGIPTSIKALRSGPVPHSKNEETIFFEAMTDELVRQIGGHPAVLGFVIQNEHDGAGNSWVQHPGPDDAIVAMWWQRLEELAAVARKAMGDNKKLIGMANHDDPMLLALSASFMAQVPSVDFWGVNNYQPKNFDPTFKPLPNDRPPSPGYNGLPAAAMKPVIITEWGMPGTTHQGGHLHWDDTTTRNAAEVISHLVPQALDGEQYPLCLGLYYFEFSDEWWKQASGRPDVQDLGNEAAGFPNRFCDEEGFGLYAVARGGNLPNNAPTWIERDNGYYQGPNLPDLRTPRTVMVATLAGLYARY